MFPIILELTIVPLHPTVKETLTYVNVGAVSRIDVEVRYRQLPPNEGREEVMVTVITLLDGSEVYVQESPKEIHDRTYYVIDQLIKELHGSK